MGSIQVLTDQWPIVLHVSEGAPSDAQYDAYVREATAILLRREPHVVIMDTTRLNHVSAYGRSFKKGWIEEYGDLLRMHCLGTALILSSPIMRFVSSTLMLIRPFPTPYFVCETLQEAMVWARQQLAENGVPASRE